MRVPDTYFVEVSTSSAAVSLAASVWGCLPQVLELRLAALCLLLDLHLLQLFLYEQQLSGQLVDLALQLLD